MTCFKACGGCEEVTYGNKPRVLLVISGVALAAQAQADFPTVPKETDVALRMDH